jgi:peptide/nickel transport system substrate-binding protein
MAMDKELSGMVDRREFLTGTALLGAIAATAPHLLGAGPALAQGAPKAGGTLKLGMSGGSTSDSLNPTTYTDVVPVNIAFQIMNGMIEIDDKNQATPELLESWEAKPGATEWVFVVRKGVTFHNGKTLDADDIIYSLNLHRGETKSAAKAVLSDITDVKKLGANQLQITLSSGNADLPYLLSDYHIMVVPNGFTDWAKPIGTGGYALEVFEPGVRAITKKHAGYWKAGRGHVDSIETININDTTARTNALISGQVDVINRLDGRTVDLLKKNPKVQVIRTQAGQHGVLAMNCTSAPYSDKNVRLALKYAIDREKIIKTVLNGYGVVANDHPVPRSNPFCATDLPQHSFDPDKAKFYLKEAGLSELKATLSVADAAFTGATDTAVLFQAAATKAGITIEVKREPSDGYWDKVWMKAPFSASYWLGRPTADQMLAIAYKSDAKWDETFWKSEAFDKLLVAARAELDQGKRKGMYAEMQKMVSEDAGAIIPMFIDFIDAGGPRVKGLSAHPIWDFMGYRLGEKVWLEG